MAGPTGIGASGARAAQAHDRASPAATPSESRTAEASLMRQHGQLAARTQSMPHASTMGPRSSLSLLRDDPHARSDSASLLAGRARSDHFVGVQVDHSATDADDFTAIDLHEDASASATSTGEATNSQRPAMLSRLRATSAVQAVGSTAHALADGATAPLRGLVSFTGTAIRQARRPALSSARLQAALDGVDSDAGQRAAHAQVLAYGQSAATHAERIQPFVHSVMKLAVAGTSMAFGLGRNSGLAAATAATRAEQGHPQSRGFGAGGPAPARPLTARTLVRGAEAYGQSLLMGSATGAVGNLLGQFAVGPIVNMVPRQFAAIDVRAIVPDAMVTLMNQLEAGSGDALRAKASASQTELSAITSDSNVRLGQTAFDVVTAARSGLQGAEPLGTLGQVTLGLTVSATAGAVIGAGMALRQSVSTLDVPDLQELQQAASQGRPLAEVPTRPAPLFYAKQVAPAAGAAQGGDRVLVARMGRAVQRAFADGPLMEPAGTGQNRALQTASNIAGSIWRRGAEMAKATVQTTAFSTASDVIASATEGAGARRAVLGVGNSLGIHAAIRPWFGSLARAIPVGDAAAQARRRRIAEESSGADGRVAP